MDLKELVDIQKENTTLKNKLIKCNQDNKFLVRECGVYRTLTVIFIILFTISFINNLI